MRCTTRCTLAGCLTGALLALVLVLAAGCREGSSADDWLNPDEGRRGAPVELSATDVPYAGRLTGGIGYYRVSGLPPGSPHTVTVGWMDADADLFVFGDAAFTAYRCSSISDGAVNEACTATAGPRGDLYVEVYGYTERPTTFRLDAAPR